MIFVLMALATARLTRFITTDVLFDAPRAWVVGRLIEHEGEPSAIRGKFAYLIVCDWCASVYVGAAVSGAWMAWGETMWFMGLMAALAASYATGFLSSITDRGE
jgi:hypothetical protein